MKQFLLRMMAGTVAITALVGLVFSLAFVPVKFMLILGGLFAFAVAGLMVYKVGDFIGYVLFNGRF